MTENVYWGNRGGKYQYVYNMVSARIPDMGGADDPNVESIRLMTNAYYDYYNNGGCNRFRIQDLKAVKLKKQRGTEGSKALTKIKSYGNTKGFFSYMKEGLEPLYEDAMNAVIEEFFGEYILDDLDDLDTLSVTFKNGQVQTITKRCLIDNYLMHNEVSKSVVDYTRTPS